MPDTGIDGSHAAGAGQIDDSDPVSRRQRRVNEALDDIPEPLETAHPDDARLPESGIINAVLPGDGAGMGGRSRGAAPVTADFRTMIGFSLTMRRLNSIKRRPFLMLSRYMAMIFVRGVFTEIFQHVAFIDIALVAQAGYLADAYLAID